MADQFSVAQEESDTSDRVPPTDSGTTNDAPITRGTWEASGPTDCASPLSSAAWTDASHVFGAESPTAFPHPQSTLALELYEDQYSVWTIEAAEGTAWRARRWTPHESPITYDIPDPSTRVLLRDIENDGVMDVITIGPRACVHPGGIESPCIPVDEPDGFGVQDAEIVTLDGERRLLMGVTAIYPGGGPGPIQVFDSDVNMVDSIYFDALENRLPYFLFPMDFDHDNRLDLYVCNDFGGEWGGNELMRGTEGAQFTLLNDTGLEIAMHCMSVSAGDWDADGQLELFITGTERSWLLTEVDGQWFDLSARVGLPAHVHEQMGWGSMFTDLDNDGQIDIINGTADHAGLEALSFEWRYLHHEGDVVVDRGAEIGLPTRAGVRAVLTWDLNGDGVQDLLGADFMRQQPWLFLSNGCTADNYVAIDAPSATRVTVRAGGVTREGLVTHSPGFATSQPPRAWFGLGTVDTIDEIRLEVPGMGVQVLEGPLPARQVIQWTPE